MEQSAEVTIVTGGSRGIGAGICRELAARGHTVAVVYRTAEQAAARVVAEITAAGGRAVAYACDVTDAEAVDELFLRVAAELGPVTGLVNNAGATLTNGDLADTDVDSIRAVLELNLTASILCARRAVQAMSTARGGRGGSIVNISSAAATLGSAHEYVHYAAAKAGVDALTIGLAVEVAREGIRVNAVAPGIVRTDIHVPGRIERVGPQMPMGRVGEVAEIAPAVGYLMSPGASYTSGSIIRVAGGR